MATWDVFHGDRLEVERGLDDAAVRDAFARGALTELDLIRPAGSAVPWEPLGDRLDLLATPAAPPPSPSAGSDPTELDTRISRRPERDVKADEAEAEAEAEGLKILDEPDFEHVDAETSAPSMFALAKADDFFEIVDDDDEKENVEPAAAAAPAPAVSVGAILPPLDSAVAIPVPGPAPLPWDDQEYEVGFDGEPEYDPLEEDEAVAEFTLARSAAQTVEELDLAAMVDVAFQLVLFFLVTATTILYKSLEVPKPNADAPPEAAAQGRSKSLDDLKADFILVEIDASGGLKIDRQPVPGNLTMPALAERLRTLRTDTGRTAMLLTADFSTPHRNAVLAYDAANEIGLRIAIARPTGSAANPPPPALRKG